jgi:diacylglycerol kinase (ATP)
MKKLINSFKYAFNGLSYATKTQLNFRIHLFAAVIAFLLGWYLHLSANEWLWIILAVILVLVAELLNTAIEILTDLVSPGYHEKAGHVKDVSAAAVTIAAVFALVTGLIIFLPKIIALF